MLVVDDYLKKEDFTQLQTLIMYPTLPWYYYNYKVDPKEGCADLDISHENQFQFLHNVFDVFEGITSPLYESLLRVFGNESHFVGKEVIRIKLNLLPKTENIRKSSFHTDVSTQDPYTTAIFYVNSNNGSTFFEDDSKVDSQANRLVIFDGSKKHFGTTCTDKNVRVVINFNFLGQFKL